MKLLPYECSAHPYRGATMPGKHATMVSPTQERAILGFLATTRFPARDDVLFLLSMPAGLRATAMASPTCGEGSSAKMTMPQGST